MAKRKIKCPTPALCAYQPSGFVQSCPAHAAKRAKRRNKGKH